jgi:hypothetical protein
VGARPRFKKTPAYSLAQANLNPSCGSDNRPCPSTEVRPCPRPSDRRRLHHSPLAHRARVASRKTLASTRCVGAYSATSHIRVSPSVHPTGHYWQRDGPRPSQARTDGIESSVLSGSFTAGKRNAQFLPITDAACLARQGSQVHSSFPPPLHPFRRARPRRTVLGRLFIVLWPVRRPSHHPEQNASDARLRSSLRSTSTLLATHSLAS